LWPIILNRKFVSAFSPSSFQTLPAMQSFHSLPKTMSMFTAMIVWLKSSFHRASLLLKLIIISQTVKSPSGLSNLPVYYMCKVCSCQEI